LAVVAQDSRLSVTNVAADQFAARIGFRPGDRIISVNGTTVVTSQQFLGQLATGPSGEGIADVRVDRGGRPQTLRLDLLALRLGTDFTDQSGGVQLGAIAADSPAARARLNPGDQIVSINGQNVSSLADARSKLSAATALSNEATLMIRRGGALEFARVRPSDITSLTPEAIESSQ
jgi:serine protease Do